MSDTTYLVLVLCLGYLLGSIPFGYVLVRLSGRGDIRDTGSGNIGATNVARSGAKGLGVATLVLDALKGWVAVYLAQMLAQHYGKFPIGYEGAALAGLCAVLGHMFPVWLGFRGGKGVATALGVFLALSPLAAALSVLVFIAVVATTRLVSLASIVAAVAVGLLAVCFSRPHLLIVDLVYLAIPLLVIWKHRSNLERLRAGTEPRFGVKTNAVNL